MRTLTQQIALSGFIIWMQNQFLQPMLHLTHGPSVRCLRTWQCALWLQCLLLLGSVAGTWAASAPRGPLMPGGVAPVPVIHAINVSTQGIVIDWSGLRGPFQVQSRASLFSGQWQVASPATVQKSIQLPAASSNLFYRVVSPTISFVGASVCAQCHRDIHATWAQTAHATAFDALKAVQQDKNATCLVCHTVGFGSPTGFQDEATTPQFAGVQCENCHGPAGDHIISPYDVQPVIRSDSELCGGCHSPFHHATYDEWRLSKHSRATPAVQSSPYAQMECLQCHSQDYRLASAAGDVLPTLATAHLSIECSTCHAPHGDVAQDNLLRQPAVDLCGECHMQAEAPLGQSPHHPQAEMLKGLGALQADGSPLISDAPHGLDVVTNACVQCHVVQHAVEQPNGGFPVVTAHTFNPFDDGIKEHQASQYNGCLICHLSNRAADTARRNAQKEIGDRLNALAAYFNATNAAYIDPARLSAANQQRLQVAKFNFEFVNADGSRGVHNIDNAEGALDVAEQIIQSLKP